MKRSNAHIQADRGLSAKGPLPCSKPETDELVCGHMKSDTDWAWAGIPSLTPRGHREGDCRSI